MTPEKRELSILEIQVIQNWK